ncbi:thioredoxin-dependent thiol peroxidase [Ferrovibrio sp.]|uniref:thioredoxin-dependent thiol peroxidase n=1 Tax=Ferrovibrio sp. TaxID=1917215 RepID=UPI0025C16BED|nr:thioredoxin-dependent thiol peroxidase [Ferrovibrio sp.]MBX3456181.1 thioredoxin-dependent thiol peroxidase [Ferrovibrio sp.]
MTKKPVSKESASKDAGLQPGDKAPAFSLPGDGGEKISLSALKGKNVVLYFYPKDDTSGCTKEAIDFSAAKAKFEKLNTVVIGCSRDSVASHDKFKLKHKLRIALAADEEGAVCAAYGVWVEKSLYGRKYMGIERTTFFIDEKGVIKQVWRKVKVPGHADAVLTAIRDA